MFVPISTSHGLSDLVVNAIYKDTRGYVWLGTGMGLDRFDGNNVKSFPIPGENLNLKRVRAIVEGPQREIYMGNASGLFVLQPFGQSLSPLFPDKINMGVNALVCKQDTLFIATDAGLFAYDTERKKLSRYLLDLDVMSSANTITSAALSDSGALWLASARALSEFDMGKRQFKSYPSNGPYLPTAMTIMGDTIYTGTHGGGVVAFSQEQSRFVDNISLGNDLVTSISSYDGRIVVSTDGSGIYVYNPATGATEYKLTVDTRRKLALRSNSVYSVMVDESGLLFIGYYQDGVDYSPLQRDIFEVYELPEKYSSRGMAVRAIAVEDDFKLIGTREGLYYVNDCTGEVREIKMPQIKSNIIFCIKKWHDKYFVGTYGGGMYIFNPSDRTLSPFMAGSTFGERESVFTLAIDMADNLWVGTSSGLYMLANASNPKVVRAFTDKNSHLPRGNIYEIFFDSTGRGWICTETGMAIWNGSDLRSDGFPQGFINKQKIRDVFEDSKHNLYFVPDRGDITRSNLELTEFMQIGELSSATNRAATFIFEDNDGNLWVGSEIGLAMFDSQQAVTYFSLSDGLPGKVFTLCSPVKDDNGDFWLGNNQGLVRLNIERMRHMASMKSLPELTDIASNGKSVLHRMRRGSRLYSLDLESRENNLTIHHANFDYILPDDQMVEYMLDGYDSKWKMKTGRGDISYFNLPSGNYRFRIRQAGDPTSETSYEVFIRPKVNILAVLMFVGLLVLTGVAIHLYILHRKHQEENSIRELKETEVRQAEALKARQDELNRYKTTRLSDEECKRLFRKLENLMRTEKPFVNPNLKSAELASMCGTTAHALSFLFNQYLHKSYYDYVNEYRVEEFKRLVANTDTSRFTLTAMSQMCGFSSRASFFRHFKNLVGVTPADYLKSAKNKL